MQSLSGYLLLIGIPIMAAYFYQFGKTMKVLDDAERKRYVDKAGSKWNLIATILLFGALIYFNDVRARLAIALTIILFTVVETYRHHKKLRALKFEPAFERRLLRISYLSAIGLGCVLASIVLSAHAT